MFSCTRGRIALIVAAASVSFGSAHLVRADINFTPPAGMLQGGPGTLAIREVYNGGNGAINNQTDARNAINSPNPAAIIRDYTAPGFDLFDSDNNAHGHFFNTNPGFERNFNVTTAPGGPAVGSTDNIAVVARGAVRIPTTGVYTFGFASDDGFTLAFDNGASPFAGVNNGTLETYNGNANGAIQFHEGRGAGDTFGQINLSAGIHPFVLTYHEGGGGSGAELIAAAGTKTAFDNTFKRVGAPAKAVTPKITTGAWDTYTFDNVANMAATITAYNNGAPAASRSHTSELALAFEDAGNPNVGSHGADILAPYPGDPIGDTNNFGIGARAPLTVSAADAGRFTILVNSDDGFQFRVLDNNGIAIAPIAGPNTVVTNNALVPSTGQDGCCQDFVGKYDLGAGNYTLELISSEIAGGAGLTVYGAKGDFDSFDGAAFGLIGQAGTIAGGLELTAVPEPATLGLFGVGAVAVLARRRRR